MITNSNYEVDILVNDKPIKQYIHDNKFYVESKDGGEYSIRIDNNSYSRVLAVVSVDGLSVLTGKSAGGKDGGYIINARDSYRIKGFRYDNDRVGAFKFVSKNNSYAATKGKKAKRNCGVIGIVLYSEKTPSIVYAPYTPIFRWDWPTWPTCPNNTYGGGYTNSGGIENMSQTLNDNTFNDGHSTICNYNSTLSSGAGGQSVGASSKSMNTMRSMAAPSATYAAPVKSKGFDMGTTWGSSVESKVITSIFDRGAIVCQMDILYASRESLIEMGVPVIREGRVSYPQSFPGGFATPPSGWRP